MVDSDERHLIYEFCKVCERKEIQVLLDNNNKLVRLLNGVCEVLDIHQKTIEGRYKVLKQLVELALQKERDAFLGNGKKKG